MNSNKADFEKKSRWKAKFNLDLMDHAGPDDSKVHFVKLHQFSTKYASFF